MQVILTPSAVPNLFGPGLNGFRNEVPPDPPTQMSAEWCNSVQMELVNAITDQGYALDSLNYSQLTTALNGWKFSGSPEISSGATLFVRSGGTLQVDPGGSLVTRPGSTNSLEGSLDIQGNVTFGPVGSVSFDNAPTFNSTTTFNDTSTFNANIDFGANSISGIGGSIGAALIVGTLTSAVDMETDTILLNDSPVSVADLEDNGRMAYDGRTVTIGDGSYARGVYHPKTAYVASKTSVAAPGVPEDIPAASIQMVIDDDEWVYVRLDCIAEIPTSGNSATVRVRATNGVDSTLILNSGDDDAAGVTVPLTTANNQQRVVSIVVRWKPTNDVPAPANTNWTFQVVHIVGSGGLVTTNVFLQSWYELT